MMNEQEKIIELIQLKMQRDNLDPELIWNCQLLTVNSVGEYVKSLQQLLDGSGNTTTELELVVRRDPTTVFLGGSRGRTGRAQHNVMPECLLSQGATTGGGGDATLPRNVISSQVT
jgi:hypothetical protein